MLAPLKNKKKIELLFRLGEKKSSGFFECRHLSSSEDEGVLRFVVVAPKKNFPRAVDRNKIKRRMFSCVFCCLYMCMCLRSRLESSLKNAKLSTFNCHG